MINGRKKKIQRGSSYRRWLKMETIYFISNVFIQFNLYYNIFYHPDVFVYNVLYNNNHMHYAYCTFSSYFFCYVIQIYFYSTHSNKWMNGWWISELWLAEPKRFVIISGRFTQFDYIFYAVLNASLFRSEIMPIICCNFCVHSKTAPLNSCQHPYGRTNYFPAPAEPADWRHWNFADSPTATFRFFFLAVMMIHVYI